MDNKGRISSEFADDLLADVLKRLDDTYQVFPVHVSLDASERTGGFKLGDKTSEFLEKGKFYMNQAPQFLPGFVDKDETLKDANYALKMIAISRKMNTILTEVDDMATIAGSEALSSILSYYNNVKDAAKKGVPGAKAIYDDLAKRFPGRTPSNGTPVVAK
jgi:hypothetical protein